MTKMALTGPGGGESPPPNMNTGYFGNYQLLGDSQFVRFCVEILNLKSTLDDKRRAQIGFCISGQDSSELARLVIKNSHCLGDNLIIMIGTNDIKKEIPRRNFMKAIQSLKSSLEWKNVIWLTIPPIPKFMDSKKHIDKLNFLNNDIKKLHGNNIKVLDAYTLFMDEYGRPRTYCFEEYFYSKKPRIRRDDIHLNRIGFLKLCTWLCFHLLPQKLDVIQNYRDRNGGLNRLKLYQEFLYLSSLLPNPSDISREDLYEYIMGPPENI